MTGRLYIWGCIPEKLKFTFHQNYQIYDHKALMMFQDIYFLYD